MFRGVEGATLMPGQKVVCVMDYRKPRADGVDSLAFTVRYALDRKN